MLRVHPNSFAIVDPELHDELSRYRWKLVKSAGVYYAARRQTVAGKTTTIKLHRQIMQTPPDMDCHHKNRKPLDCRRENLENLSKAAHATRHSTPI